MTAKSPLRQRGFTLIEVLVAMFILSGAMLVISFAWSGNFLRIRKVAMYNDAATLLERKMVELEVKYKEHPISEIPEEESGDFGSDYPQYRWAVKSKDLKLPDLTPLLVNQENGAEESLISMVKQVSEFLSKAIKEVKVSVFIKSKGKEVEFSATQYLVDYTQGFSVPGGDGTQQIGGGSGSGAGAGSDSGQGGQGNSGGGGAGP
jgi:prepilin-type N-terminal cleavage/methylation domain-containing protein